MLEGAYTYNEVMTNESENKNELVTYEDICEEAFEPSIDLMMKKYDVLSMTNVQLGNAYQEVRDAVEKGSEEFMKAYLSVIKKLLRRYKKQEIFDLTTEPPTDEEKRKIEKRSIIDYKDKNPSARSSYDEDIKFF